MSINGISPSVYAQYIQLQTFSNTMSQVELMKALENTIAAGMAGSLGSVIDSQSMLNFMRNDLNDAIQQAVQTMTHVSNDMADSVIQNHIGDSLEGFFEDVTNMMMELIVQTQESNREGTEKAKEGQEEKSWFVVLAMALGEVMNNQADKIEILSGKMGEMFQAINEAQIKDYEEVQSDSGAGANASELEGERFSKMQEFQAEAQVMNILAQTVQNVVSTLGQSLSTASRKQ